MPWLYVTVRLHDQVVEERLCAVTDEVWFGDVPEAAIAFPGARVLVRRHGARLQVQGRWLDPGGTLRMRKGAIDVRLEAVTPRSGHTGAAMARPRTLTPDVRLFVATAAMVLLGAWFETAMRFVEAHPSAVDQVQALLQPVGVGERVSTARPTTTVSVQALEDSLTPGWAPPISAHPAAGQDWPPAVYLDLD